MTISDLETAFSNLDCFSRFSLSDSEKLTDSIRQYCNCKELLYGFDSALDPCKVHSYKQQLDAFSSRIAAVWSKGHVARLRSQCGERISALEEALFKGEGASTGDELNHSIADQLRPERPPFGVTPHYDSYLKVMSDCFEFVKYYQGVGDHPVFHVNQSPFRDLGNAFKATRSADHRRRAILSLAQEDRDLLADQFFSFLSREEDHKNLIRQKHKVVFKRLQMLPEAAKLAAEAALFSSLPLDLTSQEKEAWMLEHIEESDEKISEILKNFLSAKALLLDRGSLIAELKKVAKEEDGIFIEDSDESSIPNRLEMQIPYEKSFWLARGISNVETNKREQILKDVRESLRCVVSDRMLARIFLHHDGIQLLRSGSLSSLSDEQVAILELKGRALHFLDEQKWYLSERYPSLQLSDPSSLFFKLWKSLELLFLTASQERELPAIFNKLQTRLSIFLEECLPLKDAEIHLEILLKQFINPLGDILENAVLLKDLTDKTTESILRGEIQRSDRSSYQDIFEIKGVTPDGVRTLGKWRPGYPGVVSKEKIGYELDALGYLGLTTPSTYAKISVKMRLVQIADLFKQAAQFREKIADLFKQAAQIREKIADLFKQEAAQFGENDVRFSLKDYEHRAQVCEQKGFDLCSKLPHPILAGLYETISSYLTTDMRDGIGHDLWWNQNGCCVGPVHRAHAIQMFLDSSLYHDFIRGDLRESGQSTMTIQAWIRESSKRVFDLLLEDPKGGRYLKELPKTMVHIYCLLGCIKGSKDCTSGNTMGIFDLGHLKKLMDFDDEKSLPTENHYKHIRMWQMGLPQANMPFDKTTLSMAFDWLESIQSYCKLARMKEVSPGCYDRLEERVMRMKEEFTAQISQDTITLTPRNLFFILFGGEDEYKYWNEAQGLNPLHVFEYCMSNVGKGGYYGQKNYTTTLDENFQTIYGQGPEAKTIQDRVLQGYPHAKVIVQFRPRWDEDKPYIRGNGTILNWDKGKPLRQIEDDIWIWEQESHCDGLEYQILRNDSEWTGALRNHTIHEEDIRVITPKYPE